MAEPSGSENRRARRAKWPLVGLVMLGAAIRSLMTRRRPKGAAEAAIAGTRRYQHENPDTDFERSDWDLAPVAVVYVGTLILLVISCFVLIVAYPGALPDVARTLSVSPPGPLLQTDPQAESQRVRAEEERKLHSYYWIDRSKGVVHIPIEQAMQKLAKTGIPGFGEGQQ